MRIIPAAKLVGVAVRSIVLLQHMYKMADAESANIARNPDHVDVFAPTPPPRETMVAGKVAKQLGSAVFFGVSSILIMTVNKTVLTTYR